MTNKLIKILIAENSAEIQELYTEIFASTNYEITLVPNGLIAIEQLKKNNFQCILSSINMPSVSGVELFKWVQDNLKETPFIFVTGQLPPDNLEGFFAYINKPPVISELLDTINRSLNSL